MQREDNVKTQKKVAIYKPMKDTSEEINSADTSISGFQGSNGEKINFPPLSHSACGILLWLSLQTNASPKGKTKGAYSVTQLCLTLQDSTDCGLPGSSEHGIFPGKNTRVGCHFLPQGIFLTWRSNPRLLHLLHCQADSLPLRHLGNPQN